MEILGIVGGIGPESTIVYYRSIIEAFRKRKQSVPRLVILSIDMPKMLALIASNDFPAVTDLLVTEVRNLASAGATFGLLAANTPHVVFDDVQRQSPIPLLSIVAATCEAAKRLELKKPALFGTNYTMQGRFYPEVFSREGIQLALPLEIEQAFIHDSYFNELVNGIVLPATRERLLAIIDRMKAVDQIDGVILGGTELSLVFESPTVCGIPLLDTTMIHVEAAVAQMV